MAAKIEREVSVDVDMVHGRYGEYKVLVDGKTVVDAGAKAIIGIIPSGGEVVAAVKASLPK